jgi:hypothetical protein
VEAGAITRRLPVYRPAVAAGPTGIKKNKKTLHRPGYLRNIPNQSV